jgi:polyhydroxybutyrate depolymerase
MRGHQINHTTARAAARLAAPLVALTLTVAACGGGDDVASERAPDGAGTGSTARSAPTPTNAVGDAGADPAEDAAPRPSAGCDSTTATVTVEAEHTLDVAGEQRRYLLTVPSAHAAGNPAPLVLDFHGLSEGADIHARMSEYSTFAEEAGIVVVFPHGTGTPVMWNPNPVLPNKDLDYTDALLAEVSGTLCIDESRIYATGLSNGAMFSSLLACERSEVFAAVVPVAGVTDIKGCNPSRAVPLLSFHGTDDPILQFNGGVDLSMVPTLGGDDTVAEPTTTTTRPPVDLDGPGYPAHLAAFAARNGCDAEPTDTDITDTVVHRVYSCPEGADVEFFVIRGGGHTWPGSEFSATIGDIVGVTSYDIDATRDGWEFLSRFQLP